MGPLRTYMYGHTSLDNLHVHVIYYTVDQLAFSLYCWPSPYIVGLLLVLVAFSLYSWPSPYTVGLLPIQLAFSLYSWPSPYTVGLLPIQLAFSLYSWPSLKVFIFSMHGITCSTLLSLLSTVRLSTVVLQA